MRTSGKSDAEHTGSVNGTGKFSGTAKTSGTGRNSGGTGKASGTGRNAKSGDTGKYTGNRAGGKKAESVPVFRGVLLSAGMFLCGMLLLGAGIFSGAADTDEAFPAMALITLIAAFAGAFCTARRSSRGAFTAALLTGGLSALILSGCALAVCDRIAWTGNAGILLLCVLAGSAAAGMAAQRHRRRNKRTR